MKSKTQFEIIDVKPFVDSMGVSLPPIESFWKLGDLTGLRQDQNGRFYRGNYERGILLYALVARYQPKAILEFGTGRGYGSMCMAWAMQDHNIPGRIYTVDLMPPHGKFEWPIDWGDGSGPHLEQLSRDAVWAKAAPVSWLDRIEILTGFSEQVMAHYQGPPIEMAFIDAGHGYDAVRHDFYALLQVTAASFGILFDDYVSRPGFGVQKLINEEVIPHFDATLIYSDRRWPGGEHTFIEQPEYGMVWVHSNSLASSIHNVYDMTAQAEFVRSYRAKGYFQRIRRQAGRLLQKLGLR